MPVVEWKKHETVAIITMINGENRHNMVFCNEMLQCLDDIKADSAIKAVVLTSNDPKNFSLGVDVEWINGLVKAGDMDSKRRWSYGMNELFKTIMLYPMPVIAAINGHAFGNGAILSCACDFRFMRADRGFFCFPEITIGIPFLPGMIAFIRKAVPENKFNEYALTGKRVGAVELEKHGIIEKGCADQDELMAEAIKFAKSFNLKRGITAEIKKLKSKAIIEIMDRDDPPIMDKPDIFVKD